MNIVNTIEVPYSHEQSGALIDSQLYGRSYGFILGEKDYIQDYLNKNGYKDILWNYLHMDDIREVHTIHIID